MSITTRPFKDYEAGLNVFPLRDEEKAPAVAELAPLLQRRADEAQVKQWFARGNTNYGIACGPVSGGLWVYDFERYEDAVELFGVRGLAELSAYTRVVKTPHGGLHVYGYSEHVPRRTTKIFKDRPVDFLGEGGYVCGPGTRINHAKCPRKADGKPKEGCPGEGYGEYTVLGTEVIATFPGNPLTQLLEAAKHRGWEPARGTPSAQNNSGEPLAQKLGKLAQKDRKFADLYFDGAWERYGYPSRSEAEEAVVTAMVRAGLSDEEIIQAMEQCAVGKWRERDQSYRKLTLRKAHEYVFQRRVAPDEDKHGGPTGNVGGVDEDDGGGGEGEGDTSDPWPLAQKLMEKRVYRKVQHISALGATSFWWYDGAAWRLGAEEVVEKDLTEALSNPAKTKPSSTLLDQVTRIIGAKNWTTEKQLQEPPLNLINLRNGVLDIETGELHPHNPQLWFTSVIDIEYKPDAKCPNFLKFLSEILPPEAHPTIQEIFGYTLYRSSYARRAFMLIGEGNNGKSILLDILTQWIGEENVSDKSLQDLEYNRFSVARLLGKHVNIFADLPQTPLGKSEIFRALTGGDRLEAERKHRDSFSFKPYAKLIFSTNRLPPVREDEVDAFFERWVIIEFPYQFKDDPEKRKRILAECTTDEEKSGILNWALEGLRRLLKTGKFTADEGDSAKIRDRWMRETNPAYDFLTTYVERDPKGIIIKKNLWNQYIAWREEQGLPTIERQNEFSQLVQTLFRAEPKRVRINGERQHIWVGIRWKDQDRQDQEPSSFDDDDDKYKRLGEAAPENPAKQETSTNPDDVSMSQAVPASSSLGWDTHVSNTGKDTYESHEKSNGSPAVPG